MIKIIINKLKEYFIVTPYSKEQIAEFVKEGNLPDEFEIKRRRFRSWLALLILIGYIIFLILTF